MVIKVSGCSLIMYYRNDLLPKIEFRMVIPMSHMARTYDYVETAILIKWLNKGYSFTDVYMNKHAKQILINDEIERVETDNKIW